jgi:histidinol-phosphate aminotransferase
MKFNLESLVRNNIRNLVPYSSAREEFKGLEATFLDANENPYGQFNRYPDPYQLKLKSKLAEIKGCHMDQIFIGNGSDEVIDLAFRIFCNPSVDKALTFVPTYGMYEVSAAINDVELIQLPLDENFQINRKALLSFLADENLKLIFICSPNNPTGNLLRKEDIEIILKIFKGIVIIDEAYIDFSTQPSFLSKLNQFPNLIVSQTLSKAWGMAGIRLGLAFMNAEILSYYNKVKSPYNISEANQNFALQDLENRENYKTNLNQILKEKECLFQVLKDLSMIKKIYPSDANFYLVEVDNTNDVYSYLLNNQIIVRNLSKVVPNTIRITIGTPEENQKLIKLLKNYPND